jgi:7-cyano-7-deazaguanine synthase
VVTAQIKGISKKTLKTGFENMFNQNKKAVVLLSGGLDSATCCALAKKDGFVVYALSFDYGQRHLYELRAAKKVAQHLSVFEHRIITIDLRAFGNSSLTSDIPVPVNRHSGNSNQYEINIPNTYVPARNTIFLSYAVAWAEVLSSRDIFIGVNAIDYSGYPDCRPEFIAAYQNMANLATKAGVEHHHLTIHAPLISMTKTEIIRTGISLGVDYGITHSCYNPTVDGHACGICDSCIIRRKGFEESGVDDPTLYELKRGGF